MELTLLLTAIFGFVIVRSLLDNRAKERAEKLRMLEEALANPKVDRTMLTTLAHQLTGHPPKRERPHRGLALLLALGWLTLFSGLGIWVLGEMTAGSDVSAAGVLVSLIGFGLVTYPFALRELEARRPTT
jgi:hypothetical protein